MMAHVNGCTHCNVVEHETGVLHINVWVECMEKTDFLFQLWAQSASYYPKENFLQVVGFVLFLCISATAYHICSELFENLTNPLGVCNSPSHTPEIWVATPEPSSYLTFAVSDMANDCCCRI